MRSTATGSGDRPRRTRIAITGWAARWNGFFLATATVLIATVAGAQPIPSVSVDPPSNIDVLVGEAFSVTATFENGATSGSGDVGYGPVLEVVLPPEVSFGSADAGPFGPLTAAANTAVPGSGEVTNPLTGEELAGLPPGATYLVFELPVGSFSPDQAVIPVAISATLSAAATPGIPLDTSIAAVGLFSLGADPLLNPDTDPVIRADASTIWNDDTNAETGISVDPAPTLSGSAVDTTVTPIVYLPMKEVATRFGEGETTTGPNFPLTYTLSADVADGATVVDLEFAETLPAEFQFAGITNAAVNGSSGDPDITIVFTPFGGLAQTLYTGALSGLVLPLLGPTTTPPGGDPSGELEVIFSAIVGELGAGDVSVEYEGYVAELDTAGDPVVDPTSGADAVVSNTVTTSADEATGAFGTADLDGMDEMAGPIDVAARNIATQKSVAVVTDNNVAGLSPGDIVRFTIEGQISDYFTQDDLALQDVLGDGYDFDILNPGNAQLTFVTENGTALGGTPIAFSTAAVDPAPDITAGGVEYPFPAAGTLLVTQNARAGEASGTSPGFTSLVFDLSGEIGGGLTGGDAGGSNADGLTTGIDDDTRFTLTFEATVQDAYENPASFTGTADIGAGDSLSNDAIVSGEVSPGGDFDTDDTTSGQIIAPPDTAKTLVAVNGSDTLPVPLEMKPGDTVTYSYRFDVPTGTLETVGVEDFLPLPVLDVGDPDADGAPEAWSFDNSVLAAGVFPAAGVAAFGPASTTVGFDPTAGPPSVSVDTDENSLLFDFAASGVVVTDPPQLVTIELLYTIAVNTDPFGDSLILSNVAVGDYENSSGEDQTTTDSDQITLREPALVITKGVSATNGGGTIDPSPATLPVDGDLDGADAGDTVTYVITVENQGGSEAFNVTVTDPAVAGLTGCAVVPPVVDGNGAALATSSLDLTTGIVLSDPLEENDGTIGPPYAGDTALITVACDLEVDVTPCQSIENTATITNFAGVDGGANHVDGSSPGPYQDTALVEIADPGIGKGITGIAPDGSGGVGVTAGDTVTFEIVVTLPEGVTPGLVVSDALPAGFQYVANSVVVTPGSFAGSDVSSPTVSAGPPVDIDFGDVTVDADGNGANNSFTIELQALVLDDPANDGLPSAQNKVNTASIDFTANPCGTIEATADIDFVEPEVTVTKEIAPSTVDAGDLMTMTITYENTGTSRLYDPVITDDLDPAFVDLSTVVVPSPQGDLDCSFTSPTVTCVAGGGFTFLDPGDSRQIVITANAADGIVSGTTYENTAVGDGDSQDGDVDEERPTTDEGTGVVVADVSRDFKVLRSTSEDFTNPGDTQLLQQPPVAIGEVVSMTIGFRIREGTTRQVELIDVLPPSGLRFVPGTATLSRTSDALTASANPGGINSDGGGVVGDQVAVTMNGVTGEVSLFLGDVENSDVDDVSVEAYVLRLSVVVANDAGNDAGEVLSDRGRIRFEDGLCRDEGTSCSDDSDCTMPGDSCGTQFTINSRPREVRVAEPVVKITKTASPSAGQAGDIVTFTMVVANDTGGGSAASGFDWVVTDTLPPEYTTITGPVIDQTAAPAATVSPCAFSGNDLNCEIDRLDPGESVVLTYTAEISVAAAFGQMIVNTAMADATSLPGDNGNGPAPGAPGDLEGERTSSGGVNDLRDADDATVVIGTPTIQKTTLNPQSYFAIGDEPEFLITLAVPEGSTDDFIVTDVLPAGLTFQAGSLQAVLPAGVTSSRGASPLTEGTPLFFDLSGTTITLDFGDITAANPGDILVTYTTQVADVLANQDGTILDNVAELSFADPNDPGELLTDGPVVNKEPVRVGEPNLDMSKTITAGAVGSQAGDIVSWEVVIANVLHTTAYRLLWEDVLPGNAAAEDGLQEIQNAMLVVSGGVATRNADSMPLTSADLAVSTTNNPDDTISLPALDLPPGVTLTITFDSVLGNNVVQGQQLDNATRASYDSQPSGTDGRDNSSGPGAVDDDDDTDLDNYEESASSSLTVLAEAAIDKTVSPLVYTIGEEVAYQIRVDFIQGVSENLRVVDILPDGLTYVSHDVSLGNPGITFENPDYLDNIGAGQQVELFFGDTTNPDDGDKSNDFLVVEITARVDNVVANQNLTVLRNGEASDGSEVYVELGPDGNPTRIDFDHDGSTAPADGIPILIVEPSLSIDKQMAPASQSLGDVVNITVTVMHLPLSLSGAFDLVMVDTLPVGLTYVDGSATLPAADVTVLDAPTNRSIEFRIASLPRLQGSVTFMYQAAIDVTAVADVPLENLIELTWAGLPGATGDPDGGRNGDDGINGALNDYAAEDSAEVVPTVDSSLDAIKKVSLADDADGSGTVTPFDVLEYTVTLINDNGPLTGIVFTDMIPAATTYVPATLTTSQGVADDSGAPLLRVDVPSLAPMGQVTITFQVVVNADAPACALISNQGSVDSDQTVPEPTDWDGFDPNGDQPTDVVTEGCDPNVVQVPAILLTKVVALTDDMDANGVINSGDEITYQILIFNPTLVPLENVMFSDMVPVGPPGVSPVLEVTTTQGTAPAPSNNVVINDIGTIPSGGGVLITIRGIVNGAGTVVNVAMATADGGLEADDDAVFTSEDSGNNQGDPDLAIVKDATQTVDANGDGEYNPDEAVRYTITVSNIGSAPATNVVLEDPLPTELDLVSVSASGGIVVQETPTLIVNLGTLAPGESRQVVIDMTIPPDTPSMTEVDNVATATDAEGDDVSDDANIIIIALPDLAIQKDGPTEVAPGTNVTLVYTIVNVGEGPTTGPLTVTDPLPPELTFVSGGGDGWTCGAAGQLVTCTNPGPLGPGEGMSFTMVVEVADDALGTIVNTAAVTTPDDPNPENNTDDHSMLVVPPAPAPALSPAALVAALMVLMWMAELAIRRRSGLGGRRHDIAGDEPLRW